MNDSRCVDLHLHTCRSDGTFTPHELIERARALNLSAISITDHDTVASVDELKQWRAWAGSDLEIISGIELTVSFRNRELHLLGYGFSTDDAPLLAFLEAAHLRRLERLRAMLEQLRQKGIVLSWEELMEVAAESRSPGRPHLAELMVRRRAVGSLKEAYDRFLGDSASCFVRMVDTTVEEACRLIRRAGGVIVLAHPFRLVRDEWCPELAAQGVQGVEAYHSEQSASVSLFYQKVARELDWIETGGSDCHGFRKSKGPLIGTVPVPYRCLEAIRQLQNAA